MPSPFDVINNPAMLSIVSNLMQPRMNTLGIDQAQQDPIGSALQSAISQYKPETTNINRLNQLIDQYPQRGTPSTYRNILAGIASGAGARPAGIVHGSPIGFTAPDPAQALQTADLIRYRPFYQQLQDWQNKVKPVESAANVERYTNANNERMLNYLMLGENRFQRTGIAGAEQKSKAEDRLARVEVSRNSLALKQWLADNPNLTPIQGKDGMMYGLNPKTGETTQIYTPDGDPIEGLKLDDRTKLAIQASNAEKLAHVKGGEQRANIAATGAEQRQTAVTRARVAPNLPIFTDAASGKNYQQDPVTREMYEVEMGTAPSPVTAPVTTAPVTKQPIPTGATPSPVQGTTPAPTTTTTPPAKPGPLTKLGTKDDFLTTQDKNTMHFAQQQLPTLKDLREEAVQLEKSGYFGPIRSRMTQWAARLGTTGDYQADGVNADAVAEEMKAAGEQSKQSGDYAVGQFLMNLGLATSGATRVHFLSRGGSQALNYFKDLMNSNTSLDMFLGRLDSLQKKLTEYAKGPERPKTKTQIEQDKIDAMKKALEAIKKGQK